MAKEHVGVQTSEEQQPSHRAIDNGNPAIFKPKWLVVDDINIDLISGSTICAAILAVVFLSVPGILAAALALAIVLPLRILWPRPQPPQGLVLITGASSGIGAELSYIFASKGHDLVLVGRDEEQLQDVQRNITETYGRSSHVFVSDLSLTGSAKELYDTVKKYGLVVDVLVNGAGLGGAGDTLEQPIELAERMTILNCISLVQLTQLFGKDMTRRGRGWMLQISSVGGWMASPGQNIYHASKHYVRAFSEALSMELRAYPGVVNTQLMPGPTHTQFITRAHAEETFMMANPIVVEDPKSVAMAGYNGLCKGKRMVFSSWSVAANAAFMQVIPRSLHLTLAAVANAPLRGLNRTKEPQKYQAVRGQDLPRK